MQNRIWGPSVVVALASMTTACASVPPNWAVAEVELALPPEVERPCSLATLDGEGTLADLEVAYMKRGENLLACDAARQMAVQALKAERALRRSTSR